MKFTKIISGLLALGVLILFIKSYQNFKNLEFPSTQLVMFKSLSFYMSVESFENTFVAADKVVEEEEMAYRDTWRAEDPYFYKTGRLFYYYENIRWEGYTIREDFTFSKWHTLEEARASFPVASKMEQKELLGKLSQAIKTEIESLPDYQSMTVEMVGLEKDSYRYKAKLQGQMEELWVEVYPTELGYHEKPEDKKYGVGISQYRRHAS